MRLPLLADARLRWPAFGEQIAGGVWSRHDPLLIVVMLAVVIVLFYLVYGLMGLICQLAGFSPMDRIAVLFCASKKTLAMGLPMARVIFGSSAGLGLILAPIMLFHFIQWVIVSLVAGRQAARHDQAAAKAQATPARALDAPSRTAEALERHETDWSS